MKNIIIYTTKNGSVEKAAKLLQAKLDGETILTNIKKDNVPSLQNYDTVILAGSIYAGRIQKEILEYSNANLKELLEKRIGLFICAGEQIEERKKLEIVNSFPKEIYDKSICNDVLGYEYKLDKLNFLERFIISKIAKIKESQSQMYEDKIDIFSKAINSK